MANFDEDIKRITDEILSDGTVDQIIREKVTDGIEKNRYIQILVIMVNSFQRDLKREKMQLLIEMLGLVSALSVKRV